MENAEKRFKENEKLVPYIFNKYFADLRYIEQDILQSGRLGLWKACTKYDETKGKFCPFACKYIKDEMSKSARSEIRYRNLCEEEHDGEFEIFECIGEEDDIDAIVEIRQIVNTSQYKETFQQMLKGKTIKSIAEEEGKNYHSFWEKVNKEKERIKELYGKGRNSL